jgi:threonine/homoserine efflux transporter RhtA
MQLGSLKHAAASGGFWLAWLLLAVAGLIGSPTAGVGLAFLSVSCAVLPLAFGSTKQRISAGVCLLLGLLLAVSLVGKAKNDPYLQKHRDQSAPAAVKPPSVC